jgi:hypothetical protein
MARVQAISACDKSEGWRRCPGRNRTLARWGVRPVPKVSGRPVLLEVLRVRHMGKAESEVIRER